MLSTLKKSIFVTLALAVILCGVYPLATLLLGNLLFRDKANGSLVERDGKVVGSGLIGQNFSKPEYFHGRPSSAGDKGYDAANSSGSNLGPTSRKLAKAVEGNVKGILAENSGLTTGQVPVDLVTGSGSGLDPHISPEGAYVQSERVAKARGISNVEMKQIIANHVEGRQLGIFGEPVVNVLQINLALDRITPKK